MVEKNKITSLLSNSPIKNVPADYYPKGCGNWFEILDGIDTGKKMFFRDSIHGHGEPEKTIVFVHGNPECSYTYRDVIKHLVKTSKKSIRIIAMDHIGFGLSDQASFEMVCMDHTQNLIQLIRYLDLHNVTLIIHDWGGPIGIGAFLKLSERLSNLVILNSTVFPMPLTGLTFKNYPLKRLAWSKLPKTIPNRYWGAFASFAIFFTLENPDELLTTMPTMLATAKEKGTLMENESVSQRIFREQFDSKPNTLSSKRLVLQTPFWGHGNLYKEPTLGERDTTPFYRFIQDSISKLWGPEGQNIGVRAVIGKLDPLAKEEVLQQWVDALPQLKGYIKIFENTNHFIEEFEPKFIANTIIDVAGLD
ncbi:MAG: alpha/beta fold hydrolase [Candidatus Lokiarchaeota archaeon]|nr:alpha/beta fold hydrolase [Candidatus Lokiarchaeota archaeon]